MRVIRFIRYNCSFTRKLHVITFFFTSVFIVFPNTCFPFLMLVSLSIDIKADVTFKMNDEDCLKLMTGKLNPQMVSVDGNWLKLSVDLSKKFIFNTKQK